MEVTERRPELEVGAFLVACMEALITLGLTTMQAISVVAFIVSEIGWKLKFRAWNLGGVKITKRTATNADGSPRLWWRALGHRKSGDPHTCFYRAYVSLLAYLTEWVSHYVPRPPNTGRYGVTGARFHAGLDWHSTILDAGYKGPVTKENPDKTLAGLRSLVNEVSEYWAQHLLGGLKVDGAWGPKSRERCKAWQAEHGLPVTGELDAATKALLFQR